MPIIDRTNASEVPWRPNYRKGLITEPRDGTISTDASLREAGVGTGAPLHRHEDDDLIVIPEGMLRVRIGDETHNVGAEQTVVITPGGLTDLRPSAIFRPYHRVLPSKRPL